MTTIVLPAHLPAIAPIEATAVGNAVTSSLRSVATTMSDVSESMAADGVPDDWTGAASTAADHAMTLVAADTEAACAACTRVAVACDAFVTRIVQLIAVRDVLDHDRRSVNTAIDTLAGRIEQSTGDDTAALEAEADALRTRVDRIGHDVRQLGEDVAAAEDLLIAAFRAVDSTTEGTDEAERDTTDTSALRSQLSSLGDDPDAVNHWWNRLSPAEREALNISDPDLVGNTNGIPAGDRDDANRTSLERDLDTLQAQQDAGEGLSTAEQRLLARAKAARDALNLPATRPPVDGTLDGVPDQVDVDLILYRPGAFGGDGAVAVSYGDPDTADNTAVIVPGITNDGTNIAGQGRDAYTLYEKAIAKGESAATVAWMGYDSPSWNPATALSWPRDGLDLSSVLDEDKAEAGGRHLADFIDGLRASDQRDDDKDSNMTVIGHSYGSTTAAHAAHDYGLNADALALIGSPGAGGDGVNSAGDLRMPDGKVYAGAAANDFVSWLGRDGAVGMGKDPTQADFGAKVFPVAPGEHFHAESIDQGVLNHTSYFDAQSLDNLTAVVRGDEPDLTGGRTHDANDMAYDWARDEVAHQVEKEVATGREWVDDHIDDFTGMWR